MKNNLIDFDGHIYSTIGSSIEINNIVTSSNDITFRKVDLMSHELV